MSRKNVKYGLKSPGAMIIAVTIMAVGLLTVFGVTVAFADTIVCSPSPDPCNGTNNSDTMTANAGSNIAGFTINGLDGSDTIAANEVSIGGFGHDLTVNGNDGADTIIATKHKTIDNIVGIGGNGKDFISASGNVRLDLVLFQNNLANDPDGSRDTLNCNNNPVSKAYISVADGDVAINCKTVVKN
jgi:hypothetical protein